MLTYLNTMNGLEKALHTVLPRKSGLVVSPNIRDRINVVSGYLG